VHDRLAIGLRNALSLEDPFRILRECERWFWLLLALGIVARGNRVLATQGTYDVEIRESHARATLLAGAYLYGLYAWLCGDPLLRGRWDFIGQPHWPRARVLVRDAAVVFFVGVTCIDLFRAARAALQRKR
jgi:hypothetical protein